MFARTVGGELRGRRVPDRQHDLPNIVFDIVAGGTLAALVVPMLAPSSCRISGRRPEDRLGAADLDACGDDGPAIALIALAGLLTHLLIGSGQCAGAQALATRMLVVFAPQVIFYGLAIILGGTLQSAERFAWPALAPLLSSVTVIMRLSDLRRLAGPGAMPRNCHEPTSSY